MQILREATLSILLLQEQVLCEESDECFFFFFQSSPYQFKSYFGRFSLVLTKEENENLCCKWTNKEVMQKKKELDLCSKGLGIAQIGGTKPN